MTQNPFQFDIGDRVALTTTASLGMVVGLARYENVPDAFMVRHPDEHGKLTEQWFHGVSLEARETHP